MNAPIFGAVRQSAQGIFVWRSGRRNRAFCEKEDSRAKERSQRNPTGRRGKNSAADRYDWC